MKESEERDRYLVGQMLRHLAAIRLGIESGKASLESDTIIRYAVEHAFELLGEAAKHLSGNFEKANPGIDWRRIRSFRVDIAHPYEDRNPVDLDELWVFATADAPQLERKLRNPKFPKS